MRLRHVLAAVAAIGLLMLGAGPAMAYPWGGSLNCAGIQGVACFTPSDYGADPTGVNANDAAFLSAETAASLMGGSAAVYVPSGTYLFKKPIATFANVALIGAGPSAILKAASTLTGSLVNVTTNGVTIRSLALNGQTAAAETNCITATSVSNLVVTDVTLTSCTSDGISLLGVNGALLGNVVSSLNGANGIGVDDTGIYSSHFVTITGGRVFDNGQTPSPETKKGSDGLLISGTSHSTLVSSLMAYDDQAKATQGWGINDAWGGWNLLVADGYNNISGTVTVSGTLTTVLAGGK